MELIETVKTKEELLTENISKRSPSCGLIIIDNFYNNAMETRTHILSQEFKVRGNYPGQRTRSFANSHLKDIIQEYILPFGGKIIEFPMPDETNNDDNNIYIEIQYLSQEVNLFETLTNNNVTFNLGDKEFSIQLSNLFMRKEQFYRIKNEGLSKVNDDIYNVTEKADIIVKITFV